VGVTYDALGRMVEQNRGGAYTQVVYAPSGAKLALMNATTLQKAFVPLTGGSLAVYNSSGLEYYRHPDWIGSSRFASTPSRTMFSDAAYAPFGESYAQSGTLDLSFTGMNQDTHSNVYDFPAREYGIQGRWPSPDPAGLASVNPADPQSWNRYAYVRNSPLMLTDPTGMDTSADFAYMDFMALAWEGLSSDASAVPILWGPVSHGCDQFPLAAACPTPFYYSTFCNMAESIWDCGLDGPAAPSMPNEFFGGGGGGGAPPPPTVKGNQPQSQAQTPQQCMSSFNSSTIGKATSFFSLLDLPSTIWDWLGFGGAKAAGVGVLKAETSATVTDYSITAGTATTATTGLETVVAVGSKALGVAGSVAVVAGTAVDAQQRLVCHGLINPNDAAALGSPIMPIFP
jgi:RHS repeat-associated protein